MIEQYFWFGVFMLLLLLALWRRPAVLYILGAFGAEIYRATFQLIGIHDRGDFVRIMLPAAFGAVAAILPIKLYTERKLGRKLFADVGAPLICALIFCVIVLLGVLRAPAVTRIYGRTKVFKFLVASFFQFLFVVAFITSTRELKWCIGLTMGFAVLHVLGLFYVFRWDAFSTYYYFFDYPQRNAVGPVVLPFGHIMADSFSLYALTSFLLGLHFRRKLVKAACFAFALLCAFFCFMTAVRGPALATAIMMIGIALIWFRFRLVPVLVVVAVLAVAVLGFLHFMQDTHVQRWSEAGEEISGIGSRAYMLRWAATDWATQPSKMGLLFGRGAGATARMPALVVDGRIWQIGFRDGVNRVFPHNVPVEVLDEFGILGLAFYLIFFGLVLWKGFRTLYGVEFRSTNFLICLWALSMAGPDVLKMLHSGDLSDRHLTWIFLGLVLCAVRAVASEQASRSEEEGETDEEATDAAAAVVGLEEGA